jgi:hypothetical protein
MEGVRQPSGSVHRDNRDNAAYLKVWNGQPKLNWNFDDNANPKYGSASRRDCLRNAARRRAAFHAALRQPLARYLKSLERKGAGPCSPAAAFRGCLL